jgi:O-antigen/teichoic acid export membrane protein
VHNQIEKVFLAALVGVAPVGWYDIASDSALKVRGAIGFILGPILPAASELDALGDESRIKELYYRAHKYLALCGVPVVCWVAAISRRFVELWIGRDLRMVAVPLSILLCVNFFNLATGPGFYILAGKGDMGPGIQSAALGVILNTVLSFILIYKFGFAGAVVGTSVSLLVASAYFIAVFHRRMRYLFSRVVWECYWKPFCCSCLALVPALLAKQQKNTSWAGLAEIGILFGVLYCAAILSSGFIDQYDWAKLASIAPVLGQARKIGRIA